MTSASIRSARSALLAVGLLLATLVVSLGSPGLPSGLKADEAAYYLMADSLARDRDLVFDDGDLDRLLREFHYRPTRNLVVMTTDGWQSAHYAKPLVYPLLAAPFVGALGARGMLLLNVLLLWGSAFLGWRYLAGRGSDPVLAALFAIGFFFASAAFSYVFWLQPEILNVFLVTVALALGLPSAARTATSDQGRSGQDTSDQDTKGGERPPHSHRPGTWKLWISGAALALAAYNKPPLLAFALPLVATVALGAAPSLRARLRPIVAWTAGLAAAIVATAALSMLMTGDPTPYQNPTRLGITACPGGSPELAALRGQAEAIAAPSPAARAEAQGDDPELEADRDFGWLVRVPRVPIGKVFENLGYFLWGRHAGLLPYFPFVLLTLILFVRFARRDLEAWLLLAALAMIALYFQLFIDWNWQGGGGFIGNRYYLGAVPGFLFLVRRLTPAWSVVACYAAAGLFIGPLLLTPFGAGVPEPTLQAHTRNAPLRYLPLELSLRNLPGYRRVPIGGLRIVGRQDQLLPEDGSLWIAGADRVEMLVLSGEESRALAIDVNAPAGGEVSVRFGDSDERMTMEVGETRRLELEPGKGRHQYGPNNEGWRVVPLVVETDRGLLQTWTRVYPTPRCDEFGHTPRIEEAFYTGAKLRLLGRPAALRARPYEIEWGDVTAPATTTPGATFEVQVRLRNDSDSAWEIDDPAQVKLSYHWLDVEGEMIVRDGRRTQLARPVAPGEWLETRQLVEAPEQTGRFLLELDPVFEQVGWFSEHNGANTSRHEIEVVEAGPGDDQ